MRITTALPMLLSAALTLTACGGTSPEETRASASASSSTQAATRTVETAFGPVTIPTAPKRAVALEGGVGPLLGAGITPVATMDGDYADSFLPEEYAKVKDLPLVLGKDGPEYEKIVALKPDLMIGFVRGGTEKELSAEAKAQWAKLNAIAPTVLIRATGSAETKDATLKMSQALGDGEDAKKAKEAYEAKAAEIKKTYADVLSKNIFAPLDYFNEVNVYSPISWPGDTITDAGGTLTSVSAQETKQNATFLSAEQLTRLHDATVVLYEQTVDGKPGEGAVELQKLPTYPTIPAVKAGHAYGLPYFFADRYETGLKSLEGFETILKKLS
ncbi:ABC transporter substrate-binding protein [Gephyromycinifex aptenodytis]|uniref:ABC transporter substrate-binding protein n=1 Tax=Gephyromycinifex aptenodytis TaxID=2716227 RepID=UPI001447A9E2|nr:ABC transporter substrate-binding protein [Gephyromycinifex aptenodytis]